MSDHATKILEYILVVVETTGATPSIRAIQKHMGFASNNSVRHYLTQLAESGHLGADTRRITLGDRYAVTVHDVATE